MQKTERLWRIKHQNGTYYKGPSGIGPIFVATREEARLFASATDAASVMGHWAFAMCEIENPDLITTLAKLREIVTDEQTKTDISGTWCPECGQGCAIDDEGCCQTCGSTAVGDGAEEALAALRTAERVKAILPLLLRWARDVRDLERPVQTWETGLLEAVEAMDEKETQNG